MAEKYVDTKVWLRTDDGKVVGWDLLDLNGKIDEFNSFPWAPEADFFDWLSWAEDDGYHYEGYSAIWSSKLMRDVHPIRRK